MKIRSFIAVILIFLTSACTNNSEPLDTWVVTADLVETTPFPDVKEIQPYDDALIAHRYRLVTASPIDNNMPVIITEDILILHWAIRNKKPVSEIEGLKAGQRKTFTIQKFSDRSDLKGRYIKNGIDAFDIPLYVEAEGR